MFKKEKCDEHEYLTDKQYSVVNIIYSPVFTNFSIYHWIIFLFWVLTEDDENGVYYKFRMNTMKTQVSLKVLYILQVISNNRRYYGFFFLEIINNIIEIALVCSNSNFSNKKFVISKCFQFQHVRYY